MLLFLPHPSLLTQGRGYGENEANFKRVLIIAEANLTSEFWLHAPINPFPLEGCKVVQIEFPTIQNSITVTYPNQTKSMDFSLLRTVRI